MIALEHGGMKNRIFIHVGATKGIKELQDQFNAELKKIKALGQK